MGGQGEEGGDVEGIELMNGDCLDVMRGMDAASVDAIVTDPPYGISFMGADWDSFGGSTGRESVEERQKKSTDYAKANKGAPRYGNSGKHIKDGELSEFQKAMTPIFAEALRVAKPGAHLLCFGGTRTFHRMACAIEDAGWEIRDTVMWTYGSGFPKSMDVSKAIDKAAGAEREKVRGGKGPAYQRCIGNTRPWMFEENHMIDGPTPATEAAARWQGWGTCLKPAWEPVIMARKPLDGTVARNVLEHGTGALNIDGCRVPTKDVISYGSANIGNGNIYGQCKSGVKSKQHDAGRFPANLVHDGSDEVGELMGDAERYFYCAKASKVDRGEFNDHPTVKPNALMRWLVRLVCPPGGTVLDPFMGSGSTGLACIDEGMRFVGIERDAHYIDIARRRMEGRQPTLGLEATDD